MRGDLAHPGRQDFEKNELKPHLKQTWCIGQLNTAFLAQMERLLWLYAQAYDPLYPVICFDERPCFLIGDRVAPLHLQRGQVRYENKERILSLMLFQSSADAEKLTTLKAYVERMKEDQDEICYLTGESRAMFENSPHLEAFKEKGYEALYLTEPMDELLVQSLWDYEGKMLKSAGKGTLKLGDNQEEKEKARAELKKKSSDQR